MLVPNAGSNDAGVAPESLICPGLADPRPLTLFKVAPLADKLSCFNVDLKVVGEDTLQSGHRARLLGQNAGVIKQRPITDVHSALQSWRRHPYERIKVARDLVFTWRGRTKTDSMMLANAIKQ